MKKMLKLMVVVAVAITQTALPMAPGGTGKKSSAQPRENLSPKEQKDRDKYLLDTVRHGLFTTTKYLLWGNSHPDVTDSEGKTPLIIATEKGFTKIVKILLKNGANPDIQDSDGWTALHHAVHQHALHQSLCRDQQLSPSIQKLWVIIELLKHKVNPTIKNTRGETPLDFAANDEIAALLRASVLRWKNEHNQLQEQKAE